MPARPLILALAAACLALCPCARAQQPAQSPQPLAGESQAPAAKYPPGLTVIAVTNGSPAELAGLEAGDVILSLDGTPLVYESQIAPLRDRARMLDRRAVPLVIRSGAQKRTLSLRLAADLGIWARPPLPEDALRRYTAARTPPKERDADMLARVIDAAKMAGRSGDMRASAALWRQAVLLAPAGSTVETDAITACRTAAERAGDAILAAGCIESLGIAARTRGRLDVAETLSKQALAIEEKLAPGSLILGITLNSLGIAAHTRGLLDESEAYFRRNLAITEKLAPGSQDLAMTLNNLGGVAADRGRLDQAEELFKHALTVMEKVAPGSLDLAATLNNIGVIASERGRQDQAEAIYKRALAIRMRRLPGSIDTATSLDTLGVVAYERGRLDEAEALHKQALVIKEKLAPGSLGLAMTLANLGLVAKDRGRLDEAEAYHKKALMIFQKLAPGSLGLAMTLSNLGIVAEDRDRPDEAEALHKQALAIKEKLAPGSLNLARTLSNLGFVARDHGRLDEAEAYYRRDLAITEMLAPDSLALATTLDNLARVAEDRGRLDEAAGLFRRSWEIMRTQAQQARGDAARQEFGVKTGYVAADLVAILIKERKQDAAFAILEQGRAQALAQELSDRGVTEHVAPAKEWTAYETARERHDAAFKRAEGAAEAAGRAEAGLQSGRAQQADAAGQDAREQALKVANEAYAPLRLAEASAREELTAAWTALRQACRLAAPETVDPEAARKRLRPDTLMLEFSVSQSSVTLIMISATGITFIPLPDKPSVLEADVQSLYRTTARDSGHRATAQDGGRDAEEATALAAGPRALRSLFQKLFPPEAQAAIHSAKRIVISPDGFLWDVPFAALITNASGPPEYLGLQKALSYAQSLTVLTMKQRDTGAGHGALIVGNPVYSAKARKDLIASAAKVGRTAATGGGSVKNTSPGDDSHAVAIAGRAAGQSNRTDPKPAVHRAGSAAGSAAHAQTAATLAVHNPPVNPGVKLAGHRRSSERSMLTRDGEAPRQLPHAEEEAKRIAALYHAEAHTGVEPTEGWLRKHIGDAKIVHLATHGYLHPYSAQSSGVLLAVPDKTPPEGKFDDDGALQAWEIWSLKLKADLVVLSACETGRGSPEPGEGLIGLTRSLQYAGAKSIVASQWKVADDSTAALMTAFHRYLLAGKERDEALRLAMVETASNKNGAWSDPYYWAPFLLVGETGRMP